MLPILVQHLPRVRERMGLRRCRWQSGPGPLIRVPGSGRARDSNRPTARAPGLRGAFSRRVDHRRPGQRVGRAGAVRAGALSSLKWIVEPHTGTETPSSVVRLMEVCKFCPVRRECLEDALSETRSRSSLVPTSGRAGADDRTGGSCPSRRSDRGRPPRSSASSTCLELHPCFGEQFTSRRRR